jgi:hypothetical protein
MSAFLRGLVVFLLGAVLSSAGLTAQRGGGRGAAPERPEAPTVFDSEELKIRFEAPQGALIYTVAAPGRYASVLVNGKFLRMDSREFRDVVVEAKSSANMTEADLKGYMSVLETNPPQAKLQGFKKISVKMIKIGKEREKEAVEFVYNSQQDGTPRTFRQIAYVHAGNGFVFTCSSLEPQFGAANVSVFNVLFSRLEFR